MIPIVTEYDGLSYEFTGTIPTLNDVLIVMCLNDNSTFQGNPDIPFYVDVKIRSTGSVTWCAHVSESVYSTTALFSSNGVERWTVFLTGVPTLQPWMWSILWRRFGNVMSLLFLNSLVVLYDCEFSCQVALQCWTRIYFLRVVKILHFMWKIRSNVCFLFFVYDISESIFFIRGGRTRLEISKLVLDMACCLTNSNFLL